MVFNRNILSITLCFGLGVVFLLSGIPKVLDVNSFFLKLNEFGASQISYFAPLIASTEVVLGLCLILQINRRVLSMISITILLVYTIALFINSTFGNADTCGCFPFLDILPTNLYFLYARNAIFLIAAFYIYRVSKQDGSRHISNVQKIILIVVSSLSLVTSGFTMNSPLVESQRPKSKEDIDQNIESLFKKELDPDKYYLIFIFSPDCVHCWNVSENVKKYKEMGIVDEIVGITSSKDTTSLAKYIRSLDANFEIKIVDKELLKKITKVIPFAFVVEGGKVISILGKDIAHPTLYDLKKNTYGEN